MKKNNLSLYIFIVLALFLGGIIGWIIKPVNDQEAHEHHDARLFTCAMHPQIRQSGPGNCPLCGMELIPVGSETTDDDPLAINMSPTALQLANVQTAIVGKNSASKEIRLNGKIQPDERYVSTQTAHFSGRIEKLLIDFTGEYIARGQVIAHIYSPELMTAQEELLVAHRMRESQPSIFEAARHKLKHWKLTEEQIENIIASERPIASFPILADLDGVVIAKNVNLGDHVMNGSPLFEVADLSYVWVALEIYESDLNWVKTGQKVKYTIQSLPGEKFNGIINFIDPVINPKTRVVEARIYARNTDRRLKPEMFVRATIESPNDGLTSTITIPKTAVMWTGKRSVVYVRQSNARGMSFKMREVTLGPEMAGSYVIESGLLPGEEIAVNGTFSIDAAAQLAGKPSMMNPESETMMTAHHYDEPAEKALSGLYANYFQIKNSLVKDDFTGAKVQIRQFNEHMKNIDMAIFTGESHEAWMRMETPLKNYVKRMNNSSDISSLRNAFIDFSDQMIDLIKIFGPVHETIFVQHCPMANSNLGADWLSLEEEIRNPYYGASMLTCGEITETIEKK